MYITHEHGKNVCLSEFIDLSSLLATKVISGWSVILDILSMGKPPRCGLLEVDAHCLHY